MEEEYLEVVDPRTGRVSLIASRRMHKPNGYEGQEKCPLCPGSENLTGEEVYRLGQPWRARATKNRWPIARTHLLVTLVNEHINTYSMSSRQWADGLWCLAEVSAGSDGMVLVNQGPKAGATQPHAHAQLIEKPQHAKTTCNDREGCGFCRVLPDGLLVGQVGSWTVSSTQGPLVEGEILLTGQHGLLWQEIDDLAAALVTTLKALKGSNGEETDFNIVFHVEEGNHPHLHILPRSKNVDVLALGWSVWDSEKDPVEYAKALRENWA